MVIKRITCGLRPGAVAAVAFASVEKSIVVPHHSIDEKNNKENITIKGSHFDNIKKRESLFMRSDLSRILK